MSNFNLDEYTIQSGIHTLLTKLNLSQKEIAYVEARLFQTTDRKEVYKMGMVSVTRGSAAPTMLRSAVKQGMTFAMRKRDGKQGINYAAIGANGRLYSVNLETGEVASTSHEKAAQRTVVQTGKWEFVVNNKPTPSVVRTCRRSELRPGEVYKNKDGEELFFHLGTISRDRAGFLSVPLARTENHSVSKNPNATVHVVATGEIRATVAG